MNDYPRKGDRSRRDDDRYLFMEALLSAEEKLYISYVGRSIKDNSEKVPSVLVSELLDYIQAGYAREQDLELPHEVSGNNLTQGLILQHPLTAFSPGYFNQSDPRLFSYASEWLAVLRHDQAFDSAFYRKPLPVEIPEQLELSELLAFLRQPCRYFIQKRLGVSFFNRDVSAEDEEPFALDGLNAYLIKQRYLEAALAEQDLDQLDRKIEAEGLMPVGQIGRLTMSKYRHDCEELAAKIKPFQQGVPQRLEVDLLLADIRLVGWLDNCYESHQLSFRPAEVSARDRLSSWVQHLCLCAGGYDCKVSIYRGLSGKVYFPAITPADAAENLKKLLSIYVQGMSQPLAFDATTAHEYCAQLAKEPEKARAKVENRFYGSPFSLGLQDDLYFRRCFSNFESFCTEFEALAAMIYQPLQAYAQEGGDD
jgi:exodeoxyribonuclease V gamma subunit